MLTLKRRIGEIIDVTTPDGRRVHVEVVSTGRGYVLLGITAPAGFVIDRREVTEKKLRAKFEAALRK